jgi:hypothetical protein
LLCLYLRLAMGAQDLRVLSQAGGLAKPRWWGNVVGLVPVPRLPAEQGTGAPDVERVVVAGHGDHDFPERAGKRGLML